MKAELAEYLQALRSGKAVAERQPTCGLIVAKEKLAANGEYNLSGERYREGAERLSAFPLRRFEQVCTLEYGASLPKEKRVEGPYPVVGSNGITGYHSEYLVEGPAIIVGRKGSAGEVTLIEKNCFPIDTTYYVKQANPAESDITFLYWLLKTLNLKELRGGAGIPGLNRTEVYETHKIPLPPLEVQKKIVAEIEGYQKVINGARAVLDNYRPHIPIHPDWPMVALAAACETITDGDHQPPPKASEGVPFVTITNINDEHELDFTKTFFVPESYYSNLNANRKPRGGDILYTVTGSYGIPVLVPENITFCFQRHIALIRTGSQLLNRFLLSLLASPFMLQQGHEAATGVAQKTVSLSSLRGFQIPLPPLATQQAIVAEIEAEQALVAANRELIARFEKKIQATLARVWGEEESPAAPEA